MKKVHIWKKILIGVLAVSFLMSGNIAQAATTKVKAGDIWDDILNDALNDPSQEDERIVQIDYDDFSAANYTTSSITLEWYSRGDNDGFYLYRRSSTEKEYKKIADIKNKSYSYLQYKDNGFTKGVSFRYCLKPYAINSEGSVVVYSEDSLSASFKLPFNKITISSAKRSGTTKAVVKWKKETGATGYEIYRKTEGKSYKLAKRISNSATVQWTAQNVSKTKKTYFKVRAYKKYNGTRCYGAFGSSKSISKYSSATEKFNKKIAYLKKKFPSGKYWNHVGKTKWNSWTVTNKPCNHGNGGYCSTCNYYNCPDGYIGYQCYGFAWKLSDYIYGKNAKIKNSYSFKSCKRGDVIRYSGHSVFVVSKHSDYVTVAECNVGDTCMILWGRRVYSYELTNAKFSRRV